METKRVFFAAGSRAEYGIVRRYLNLLNNDDSIKLEILVTGSLLSSEYGSQVDLIEQDGFEIGLRVVLPVDSTSNASVINAMSVALREFGYYFESTRPDLLIILGDRYEMMSVALAASMQRIKILHIHGGEATYANYDEFIRHSITKMSHYHFTATEEYRNRVIQLGEDPKRVYNLGALGAENCKLIDIDNVPDNIIKLDNKTYCVVLFHPETLSGNSELEQITELLEAFKLADSYKYIFIGSNADTHSGIIRGSIKKFVEVHPDAYYFENLHSDAYHYLLKHSLCLIGNSSSGIIEAPSLGIFTINIGDRQKGRIRGNNVIDIECNREAIVRAIVLVMNKKLEKINNPYYKNNSAVLYYTTTVNLLNRAAFNGNQNKEFYNLNFSAT